MSGRNEGGLCAGANLLCGVVAAASRRSWSRNFTWMLRPHPEPGVRALEVGTSAGALLSGLKEAIVRLFTANDGDGIIDIFKGAPGNP